jgi:hypothetical protein
MWRVWKCGTGSAMFVGSRQETAAASFKISQIKA